MSTLLWYYRSHCASINPNNDIEIYRFDGFQSLCTHDRLRLEVSKRYLLQAFIDGRPDIYRNAVTMKDSVKFIVIPLVTGNTHITVYVIHFLKNR